MLRVARKADRRGKTARVGSHYAFGAKPIYFPLADTEAAEDFGVVLAELGGDGAHPHSLADLDRSADVRHLAQFRVARILHEAAVAHLRVGEHLRVIVDRAARYARRFEHF